MSRLSRLTIAPVLILLATSHFARAQFSLYGTVAESNYGYSFNNDSLIFSPDHISLGAGGFYNFPIQSRLTAGIDVRGSVSPYTTGGDKAAVSARFGFVPMRNPFRPYLQIGGGVIQARLPAFSNIVQAQTVTTAALDLALGLDIRLTHSVDLRLFELESGAGSKGSTRAGSASLSAGFVYHFHPSHS
jgi:hypothetical protein